MVTPSCARQRRPLRRTATAQSRTTTTSVYTMPRIQLKGGRTPKQRPTSLRPTGNDSRHPTHHRRPKHRGPRQRRHRRHRQQHRPPRRHHRRHGRCHHRHHGRRTRHRRTKLRRTRNSHRTSRARQPTHQCGDFHRHHRRHRRGCSRCRHRQQHPECTRHLDNERQQTPGQPRTDPSGRPSHPPSDTR